MNEEHPPLWFFLLGGAVILSALVWAGVALNTRSEELIRQERLEVKQFSQGRSTALFENVETREQDRYFIKSRNYQQSNDLDVSKLKVGDVVTVDIVLIKSGIWPIRERYEVRKNLIASIHEVVKDR